MKMKHPAIFLVLIMLFIGSQESAGQKSVDYSAIRDSVMDLTCGVMSAQSVHENLKRLTDIDTANIHSGIDLYCYDRGVALYFAGIILGKHKDTIMLGIEYLKRAAELDASSTEGAYHYIVNAYLALNDCENAAEMMKIYKKSTNRSNRDKDLVKFFKKRCES